MAKDYKRITSLYLPDSILEKIKEESKKLDVSRNDLITKIINDYFKKEKK